MMDADVAKALFEFQYQPRVVGRRNPNGAFPQRNLLFAAGLVRLDARPAPCDMRGLGIVEIARALDSRSRMAALGGLTRASADIGRLHQAPSGPFLLP